MSWLQTYYRVLPFVSVGICAVLPGVSHYMLKDPVFAFHFQWSQHLLYRMSLQEESVVWRNSLRERSAELKQLSQNCSQSCQVTVEIVLRSTVTFCALCPNSLFVNFVTTHTTGHIFYSTFIVIIIIIQLTRKLLLVTVDLILSHFNPVHHLHRLFL